MSRTFTLEVAVRVSVNRNLKANERSFLSLAVSVVGRHNVSACFWVSEERCVYAIVPSLGGVYQEELALASHSRIEPPRTFWMTTTRNHLTSWHWCCATELSLPFASLLLMSYGITLPPCFQTFFPQGSQNGGGSACQIIKSCPNSWAAHHLPMNHPTLAVQGIVAYFIPMTPIENLDISVSTSGLEYHIRLPLSTDTILDLAIKSLETYYHNADQSALQGLSDPQLQQTRQTIDGAAVESVASLFLLRSTRKPRTIRCHSAEIINMPVLPSRCRVNLCYSRQHGGTTTNRR